MARRFRKLVRLKLAVEARSRDTRLLAAATAGLAVLRAWDAVAGHVNTVGPQVAELLVALAPPVVATLAALSLARDRAAGVFTVVSRQGVRPGWWAHVAVSAATGFIVVACAFALVSLPAGALSSQGVGLADSGHLLASLVVAVLLWALIGTAVGSYSRSRAGAVAGVLGLLTLDVALERLATSLPAFRWPYALTPLGLARVAADGRSPVVIPESLSLIAVVAAVAVTVAAALAFAARPVGRSDRARRTRAWPRMVAVVLAFSIPVGAGAGPVLAAVLPWRASPPWLVDVLNGRTPDAAVRTTLADAAAHRTDPDNRSVALLGPVAQTLPADVKTIDVTTDLRAKRAGEVGVVWRLSGRASVRLLACATRAPRGWRVVDFRRTGECP
jgi:hypothetical protein